VISEVSEFGTLSLIFSYIILFNVILSYGLETSFFRFYNKEKNKKDVLNTAAISILITSFLFASLFSLFKTNISDFTGISSGYLSLVVWILVVDALTVIPFAYLRLKGSALKYSAIKIINILVYFSLNIFLLIYLKGLIDSHEILETIYVENHEVTYIFIANLIASIVSLLLLAPFYFEINYRANIKLLKKMLAYGFPILISGLAFTINETFDKILLDFLLPTSIAKTQIGMYAACYKLAIFMTLFSTAYKLAIEPFFFREADEENSTKSYALVLEIFVIIGSSILVLVVASLDILKVVFIGDPEYWQALYIVPIILIANFCLGIYQNLSVWYKVTDKTIFAAYISSAGALITLVLNIILIPKFSYLGSALATLLAYFIMALLSYHFGKKHYPIPYNSEKILFYFVLSVSLSSISFYGFRDNLLVGILCILIMNLVILLKEKRRINKLFKLLA
tara:strand:- start:5967 stop:7325 length:1359 start_codon:yes stop_codon:yes gene_type:complete